MKYKLIVSDFDDTLAGYDQVISKGNREAITKYVEAGGKFVLCTGRMVSAVLPHARSLGLQGEVIGYQGGVVADIATGKFLEENGIPYEVALPVCEYLDSRGIYYQLYNEDTFVVEKENEYSDVYRQFTFLPPIVAGKSLTEYLKEGRRSTTKILLVADPKLVPGYIKELSERFGDKLLVNTSKKFIIEIVPKGINKGFAVATLRERLNIPREEIIAIGDSMNDAPMLEYAGLGVVVGDGTDDAKKYADVIAPNCSEDAIKWVIENYGLK